jgi:four helix bundle protein
MVEEAQAAQSRADFNNKYNIALKEARQSIYWLRLLNVSGIMLMNNLKHFARRQSKLLELSVQS